jgi:outer membrane receptor for ferrienterochelin and colicin
MTRMRILTALAAAWLLGTALPAAAVAQGTTTGTIRGQVVSQAGEDVAGARVSAVEATTGVRRAASTGDDGRYSIPLLPPGRYRVEVSALGYATQAAEVIVRLGEAATLDVTLATSALTLETVVVSGQATRVDATQGGVTTTVTPEQVENLPTQGRDFTDFLNLSPLVSPQPGVGTGGQFAIGGQRTSGTNVQIDGADANNTFFGENRGSSRTPFAFSLESIQEFQLVTNGFDVEYGNYSGGVVNAVTRGGTNEFRGNVFGFFRDQSLTQEDFTGQEPRDYSVQQFGFSLSGPVIRDRLHYFFSVDAQKKEQPVYALEPSVVGIEADTIDKVLNILQGLGFDNPAQFQGTLPQREDNLVLFGRIDWTISDAHRLTLRQNYSDFEQTNDRLSTRGEEFGTRGGPFVNTSYSTVAELNSVFGSAFNTLRLQYSDEDRPRDPNNPGGYLPEIRVDSVAGYRVNDDGTRTAIRTNILLGGDAVLFRNRLVEDKFQLVDNFTFRVGDNHTIKVGTNNIWSSTENTFFNGGNGAYRFTTLEDLAANRPFQYSRNVRTCSTAFVNNAAGQPVICPEMDVPVAKFDALEWSLYAQDEWQVTDRLVVTPGVRIGGTRFGDEPARVDTVETVRNSAGELVFPDLRTGISPNLTGISPRLAFAYSLPGETEGVIRGGIGLLIGRAPTVLLGNVFQTERPLLSVFCTGGTVPAFRLPELLQGTGENNPARCNGGAAPSGRPEYAFFSDDFELPRTVKANLGYERVLGGSNTRIGLDLIYSRTTENFTVLDRNLGDVQFTLGLENRPVFVPAAGFNPRNRAAAPRLRTGSFDRVYYNTSDGEAESVTLAVEIDQPVGDLLQFSARYALNRAYDNSSFSCCTSFEGFGIPTAGDPNFLGDPGDDDRGTWGPSDFERRHTLVFSALWRAPAGFRVSGILRSQSGTPWTPMVFGDINGDGLDTNDRAFLSRSLQFENAAERDQFLEFLNEHRCLIEQEGTVVQRNSCRNPWFNSLDLRLSKEIGTLRGQRAEFIVDAFNVLNGIDKEWGRYMGVFGTSRELLQARGYDPATRGIVYRVNDDFGREAPVGFDPFQFQLQLGVRYRF